LYLQGLGGVWTKIRLPYIKNFTNGHHIAIHNALLVIKNFETDTTLAPPALITIIKRDSLGNISNLIDYDEGQGITEEPIIKPPEPIVSGSPGISSR